ncbi:uncharacterized protein MYCFIDRAFT_78767 [Pseudocercospora fijiensis CIRAD86]|uniref:Uncharacterized protein n=1 Tax=Pseudocercospora fijiensis (strain CIRAD86) TaxID=383855 RepID=M3AB52_PSEFD|nr:uncharacterized protein MYCFIDRAFT_78767 [Pseudocercospora fijiensis CIRAD86]EME81801.1 hypothetical protein MYCFIDRAFT_78767 [Pseudocercospora fijiensis CIRAD86]
MCHSVWMRCIGRLKLNDDHFHHFRIPLLLNDWDVVAELYDAVKGEERSVNVVHDNAGQVGLSSSRFRYFDASETNIYVTGLAGCTSILVVSRLGAYISHLWEPSFTEPGGPPNFQADVIDYLNNGRAGGEADTEPLGALVQGGVFGDTATTKIFIMTPATYSLDLDASTSGMSASLTNGDNQPLFDGATPEVPTDRLTPIRTTLAQLMPGVPISQFTYRRQTLNNQLETGAYGKAMILYSNYQKEDPDTFENLDPAIDCGLRQKAIWQCWIQGKLMGSDLWDALPGFEQSQGAASNDRFLRNRNMSGILLDRCR